MQKFRLYAIVALLVAPSLLLSVSGSATSDLPGISDGGKPLLQQNCPVDGGFGCFDGARPSPASFCRQFMQMFLRPAGG